MDEQSMKDFLADRRAMLLALDLDQARAFTVKYATGVPTVSDETLLISLHKARSGARDLPMEERRLSKIWLRDHNYRDFDYDNEIDIEPRVIVDPDPSEQDAGTDHGEV